MSEPDKVQKAGRVTPAPTLRVIDGKTTGTVFRLDEDTASIGRREDNDHVLSEPSVSRVHARVSKEAGAMIVTDLGSSGGTRVNGEEIVGSAVISHGDQITLGGVTLVFEDPSRIESGEHDTEVFEPPPVETGPSLSPRQQQVLELIAEGMTNSEIGDELGITERTVKAYATELYGRLDASNRAGAVAEAVKHGLL